MASGITTRCEVQNAIDVACHQTQKDYDEKDWLRVENKKKRERMCYLLIQKNLAIENHP
jgi:hypothetical protein